ncbi:hypothetical protein M8312_10825 [Sphingomonas sp. KRR8]|uniref:hypothetical protein n=1 Tax=Sphingomonas sp. KRR8 TaxID=2942996 RepID=UPI002021ABC5|nr:hypothetical protein [Sphingomonas sp. KRR8]URD60273.1 hypothetical protein M8312_10825 [Sphingomonas sp. KRR8]
MTRHPKPAWTGLWFDSVLLMADAAAVIGLRTLTVMQGGPKAAKEAERMVAEKMAAGAELAGTLASGKVRTPQGTARAAVRIAGKRVRANRKRLG